MTTERSELPQNQYNEPRQRASVTDVGLDIINPTPKPMLGAIGKRSSRGMLYHRQRELVCVLQTWD